GSGKQVRQVICLGSDGKVHPDNRCTLDGAEKPEESQACNEHVCPTYTWHTGDWSECSLSCGAGKRTREVKCMASDGVEADSENRCKNVPNAPVKPLSEEKCN